LNDVWELELFDFNGNFLVSGKTNSMDAAISEAHKHGYKIAVRQWIPELKAYMYVTPDGVYWTLACLPF